MSGWVAGAVAVGTIGGAVIAGKAAKGAAQTQADAAAQASDVQQQIFERQVELQEPFREAGLKGQNRLLEYLGIGGDVNAPGYGKYATAEFTPEMFKTDPGYAFRMSEGMKALERSAAARGGLLSGSTLKGIQRYGQDLASQEYTNAFNRFQAMRTGTLNPYQALSGTAQTSANVLTGAAGTLGGQLGSNIIGAGNAQAAGQIGQANAIVGGVGQGINFYQNQQLLNRLPVYNQLSTNRGFSGGAGTMGDFPSTTYGGTAIG
jgi:hypothetical protein